MALARAGLLGAVAGLAGGAAMLGVRSLERRLEDSTPGPALAAETQLAWAVAVGALYGAARSRLRLPRAADSVVLTGLVSAVEIPERRYLGARRWARRRAQRSLVPIRASAAFGFTTLAAFELLTGGRRGR